MFPKFTHDKVCDKCGDSAILATYRRAIDAVECKKLGIDLAPGETGAPEHMLRRCNRCNYQWIEMPLDASTTNE